MTMAETRGSMHSKSDVRDFWDRASCGEDLYLPGREADDFAHQAAERYRLEPYIPGFARFEEAKGQRVLEIGVGLGADHERFARAGAILSGIDLTPRAIRNTGDRFAALGLTSDLRVGDAEALPFDEASFDVVYSWGVIHHSPDTPQAAREILRVLRPGGRFSVMIYQRHSMVGYMLWLRYALARGKLGMSLDDIYAQYLESPGTKAYSPAEARALFPGATNVRVSSVLTHGDLLEGAAGQRHEGGLIRIARRVWPRGLIRRLLPNHGLFLMIDGRKPAAQG